MKKLLLMMLGALMTLPGVARDFTYTYEGQTLTYTVLDENARTCETKQGYQNLIGQLNAGNQVEGNLTIPAVAKDGEIEYTVTTIGYYAFSRCTSLMSVTIPDSVTTIDYDAFFGCTSLTSVTIPDSVTTICGWAFSGCSSLTSVTIPDSVTTIGNQAFESCSSLTSVTIPDSVTTIGYYAFSRCSSLTSVTIPDSVTTIGYGAFSDCSSLTSVTIPDSVTTIGDYAFSGCSSLTSVTIPDSVTTIGDYAFSCCSSLTSVTIPDSVTTIGDRAFEYCPSLTKIELSSHLSELGEEVWQECEKIESVICRGAEPVEAEENEFSENVYGDATLYVPTGSKSKYMATMPWKKFGNISEVDFSGIEDIQSDGSGHIDFSAPVEVYTLQGVKVCDSTKNLPSGIYILCQGKKAKTIEVK